jgi:hypothetical protein
MGKSTFAWPKKGQKLFAYKKGEKFFHLDSIFWHEPQHATAFKLAAEMVLDTLEASTLNYDSLYLPVCYLYRHCLELKLKDLIRLGIRYRDIDETTVQKVLTEHYLAQLWTPTKRFLVGRFPNEDPAPLQAVESVVNDFHQIDRKGEAFRYDLDLEQRRRPTRHEGKLPKYFSLSPLRDTMNGVFNFLDICESMICEAESHWDGP